MKILIFWLKYMNFFLFFYNNKVLQSDLDCFVCKRDLGLLYQQTLNGINTKDREAKSLYASNPRLG